MATSTAGGNRIRSLDITRGVAVMGILAMNIYAFALPGAAYFNPTAYGGANGLDWLTWAFNFVFIDSKMRGLFSVLFGASTLLVMERALATSRRPGVAHFARMAWLLVFGLIHFYFIWWGDVLVLYAMCGVILFLFRKLSSRALWRWAIGVLTVAFLFTSLQAIGLQMARSGNGPAAEQKKMERAFEQIEGFFGPDAGKSARDLKLYKSDYRTIMLDRLQGKTAKPFKSFIQMGLETLGLMLLGMALFKSGMLTGEWQPDRYRRWAVRCFAIAVPPLIALVAYQSATGHDAFATFNASIAFPCRST